MNRSDANVVIKDIYARTRSGELSREDRLIELEILADSCDDLDAVLLERMTDLCLYEELYDSTAHKSRHSEYPFLSELQLARRKNGKHKRRNESGQREVAFKHAYAVGSDGKDNRIPLRRERSDNENEYVQSATLSRNKERKKRYNDFIKTQPVVTYYVDPNTLT